MTEMTSSWRVVFGPERASNGLRFSTESMARAYLMELTSRWLGAPYPHDVEESGDPANYEMTGGRAQKLGGGA